MTAPQCRDEVRLMMSPRRTCHFRPEGDRPEPGRSGAPVSFAGVLLAPGAVYIAYVGEMRIYRFRGGRLEERTRGFVPLDGGVSDGTVSPDALAMLVQHAKAAPRALVPVFSLMGPPDGVFFRVMGPPQIQEDGATRAGA
ncbi:hypothetical protein [Sorangium sp. So ce204]|uniref:hypothetical protein n=1 Tax=Sorangium sp. So ce204 TaxID=3133288 RepID=UPI003F609F87